MGQIVIYLVFVRFTREEFRATIDYLIEEVFKCCMTNRRNNLGGGVVYLFLERQVKKKQTRLNYTQVRTDYSSQLDAA